MRGCAFVEFGSGHKAKAVTKMKRLLFILFVLSAVAALALGKRQSLASTSSSIARFSQERATSCDASLCKWSELRPGELRWCDCCAHCSEHTQQCIDEEFFCLYQSRCQALEVCKDASILALLPPQQSSGSSPATTTTTETPAQAEPTTATTTTTATPETTTVTGQCAEPDSTCANWNGFCAPLSTGCPTGSERVPQVACNAANGGFDCLCCVSTTTKPEAITDTSANAAGTTTSATAATTTTTTTTTAKPSVAVKVGIGATAQSTAAPPSPASAASSQHTDSWHGLWREDNPKQLTTVGIVLIIVMPILCCLSVLFAAFVVYGTPPMDLEYYDTDDDDDDVEDPPESRQQSKPASGRRPLRTGQPRSSLRTRAQTATRSSLDQLCDSDDDEEDKKRQ